MFPCTQITLPMLQLVSHCCRQKGGKCVEMVERSDILCLGPRCSNYIFLWHVETLKGLFCESKFN